MSVTNVLAQAVASAIGSVHPCGVPEQIKNLARDAAVRALQLAAEEAISVAREAIETKMVEEGYELVEGFVEGVLRELFYGLPAEEKLEDEVTSEESEAT